mgnify:CR=1 FL=1
MNTNIPSWKKLIPLMPFSDYQNFMQKNSEIERLRQTWKELWKLIQGYNLTKDAIYELDDDVQTLSAEVTALIEDLSSQVNAAVNEYSSSEAFQTLIDAMVSNIAYEYSQNKIDKVPDATPGNVSVFDSNHGLQDSGVDILTLLNSGGGSGSSEIETTESLDDLRDSDDGIYVNVGDFPWEISAGDGNYCTRRIIQHKIGTYIENNSHTVQIGLFNPLINIDLNDNECKLCYRICEVLGDNSEWFELNARGESGSFEIEIESDSLDYLGYFNDGVYVKLGDPWTIDFGVETYLTRRIIQHKISTYDANFDYTNKYTVQIGFGNMGFMYLQDDYCKLFYRVRDEEHNYSEWFALNGNTTKMTFDSLDDLKASGKYENIESGWTITVDSETVLMRTVEVSYLNDKDYQRGLCYADDRTFYASRVYDYNDYTWSDWVKE